MNPTQDSPASQPMPGQPPVAAPQLGDVPMQNSQLATALTTPTHVPEAIKSAPPIAHDGDLIEKEWALKAKQVVMATQHDPYEQNRQLAALKADYVKKRYGKEIKVSE